MHFFKKRIRKFKKLKKAGSTVPAFLYTSFKDLTPVKVVDKTTAVTEVRPVEADLPEQA